MNNNRLINIRFSFLVCLVALASFSRMLPHITNFSPVGALGLFCAAYFHKQWQSFFIPIFSIWMSDLFINNVLYAQFFPKFTWFYQGFYWQYGSYAAITLFGLFLFKKINTQRVLVGALASTVIFFVVSNFGSWIGSSFYPQDFNGLMACYVAGIPFIKGTLLGDLFYSGVLFGCFTLAQKQFPVMVMLNEQA